MKRSSAILLVAVIIGSFSLNALIQNVPYSRSYSIAILPGEYHYFPFYVVGEGRLSGDFVESQAQLVSFYFLTDQQYDAYKSTGIPDGLFSISDAAASPYDTQIPSPGNYFVVIAHGTGYDSSLEQVTLHLRLDGTNSPYLGLEGLILVSFFGAILSVILARRENRRQILSLVKAYPNYGYGKDEDDGRILTIAKEFCRNLGSRFDPVTIYYVSWLKFAGIRPCPSDYCFPGVKGPRRGWLHLPAALRGKLSPDEWKPLIASSLIYMLHPRFQRKRRLSILVVPLVVFALVVAGFVLVRLFYAEFPVANSALERFILLQFPIALVPTFFLFVPAARKWNLSLRNSFLQADDIAARMIGRDALLGTLAKIDSMMLPDIEQGKRDKPSIWTASGSLPWPSITQRIQRLQAVH